MAAAAALWLAANLRANHLADQGAKLLAQAKTSRNPGPLELGAAEDYRAARRFAPDAKIRVQQSGALLVLGRRHAAERTALRAAEAEPENVGAWLLLYSAVKGHDRVRAAEARRRVLALDPGFSLP